VLLLVCCSFFLFCFQFSYERSVSKLTRKRPIRRRKTNIVQPSHRNERPTRRRILRGTRREASKHDRGDREEQAVGQIAADHRPPAADLVDEQDTAHLRYQSQHGGNTLVLQRVVGFDAHVGEDGLLRVSIVSPRHCVGLHPDVTYRAVVLNSGHASHLHTSLDSADEHETAERRLVLEQLHVRLSSILMLVLDRVADLVVLGAHPRVVFVAVGMQSGESLESFLRLSMINKPSARRSEPSVQTPNKPNQERRLASKHT
jgi:hypothetical protein